MTGEPDLERYSAAVIRAIPDLAGSRFRFLARGWHSTAIEAQGLVFKFPRDAAAERALRREAAVLAVVRDRVTLPVPSLRIHEGPQVFSSHGKLEGGHLLAADYRRLPEGARRRLGEDLAGFYAELHAIDSVLMTAAGAEPVAPWQPPEVVARRALPALPAALREAAEATVLAFADLPPDPFGRSYGFFDGHGWNMAFDHARGRLNGIYDFADSGLGPLHQDFVYASFIAPELAGRIVAGYEALTGRALDGERIRILTGFHRLSELAELADDPEHAPAMLRNVLEWFEPR